MRDYVVIVPVREFQNTKLRLSHTLSKKERADLTRVLLRNVLAQVEKSRALETIIVASSTDLVRDGIQEFAKSRVIRESKRHGGVNSAMADGLRSIRAASYQSCIET